MHSKNIFSILDEDYVIEETNNKKKTINVRNKSPPGLTKNYKNQKSLIDTIIKKSINSITIQLLYDNLINFIKEQNSYDIKINKNNDFDKYLHVKLPTFLDEKIGNLRRTIKLFNNVFILLEINEYENNDYYSKCRELFLDKDKRNIVILHINSIFMKMKFYKKLDDALNSLK